MPGSFESQILPSDSVIPSSELSQQLLRILIDDFRQSDLDLYVLIAAGLTAKAWCAFFTKRKPGPTVFQEEYGIVPFHSPSAPQSSRREPLRVARWESCSRCYRLCE